MPSQRGGHTGTSRSTIAVNPHELSRLDGRGSDKLTRRHARAHNLNLELRVRVMRDTSSVVLFLHIKATPMQAYAVAEVELIIDRHRGRRGRYAASQLRAQ